MAAQQSTSKDRQWKRSSDALNDRLCAILPKDGDEDGYLLFARPQTNIPVVCAALGAALAAQRQSVELSQRAVAERASMSTARLRAIEKGRSQPTMSVFLSLCEAMGVDPRELFNRALLIMGYPVGYVSVSNLQPTL